MGTPEATGPTTSIASKEVGTPLNLHAYVNLSDDLSARIFMSQDTGKRIPGGIHMRRYLCTFALAGLLMGVTLAQQPPPGSTPPVLPQDQTQSTPPTFPRDDQQQAVPPT